MAKRSLAADRGRNMVAVFTIGLAVCLMASVAFIYSAMHESTVARLRGQYQSGCSELSYEDIERLAEGLKAGAMKGTGVISGMRIRA